MGRRVSTGQNSGEGGFWRRGIERRRRAAALGFGQVHAGDSARGGVSNTVLPMKIFSNSKPNFAMVMRFMVLAEVDIARGGGHLQQNSERVG